MEEVETGRHPVVTHLTSESPTAFLQPSAAAAAAVTARPGALGADLLAPLEADASQLAVIAAAAAGASFLVDAAPGTGATQTIANLAVHCATAGKSVLVIGAHAAALRGIAERLVATGFGEIALDLAAASDARTVLAQLARVAARSFRPASSPVGEDMRVPMLREALDAYVAALHHPTLLGRSVHSVLGRLVELRTTPCAELAERDSMALDAVAFERRRTAIAALADATLPVEPVATHPWRLAERTASVESADVLAALDEVAAAAAALNAAVRDVAALVPGLVARTREQLVAVGALADCAAQTPRPGAELLEQLRSTRDRELDEAVALVRAKGGGELDVPKEPRSYLELAAHYRALAAEVVASFTPAVEKLDAHALWAQLKKWSTSVGPVRYVALRSVRADLRIVGQPDALESDESMLVALEALIAERAVRTALVAAAEPAKRWFGELWGDAMTAGAFDVDAVERAIAWATELRKLFERVEVISGDAGRATAWRALVAQVAAGPETDSTAASAFARLAAGVARWQPAVAALADLTGIPAAALGAGDDHLAVLREEVEQLRAALPAFPAWIAFHAARREARSAGVDLAVNALERGDLGAAELPLAWERATLATWLDAEMMRTPALAGFLGENHHAQVAGFADLDRAALAIVRSRALVKIAGIAKGPEEEVAWLTKEVRAKSDLSLEAALAGIPNLLTKIAPCVLATPTAAALLSAATRFDVVVIEGAAELATAEVIDFIGRGDSAVLIGDPIRLGPSAGRSLYADAIDARFPELRLGAHYRSRHEDLFALANARWYGNRIQVLPAAASSADLGITWRRVDRPASPAGEPMGSGEVGIVVNEVLARLSDPGQRTRTLAVLAFTEPQRAILAAALEAARAADPALALDAAAPATEPWLVELVDRAVGLERDVIIVALGDCGPEVTRARLALATTRAKEQLVLVSTRTPEDVLAAPPPADATAPVVTPAAVTASETTVPVAAPTDPTGPIAFPLDYEALVSSTATPTDLSTIGGGADDAVVASAEAAIAIRAATSIALEPTALPDFSARDRADVAAFLAFARAGGGAARTAATEEERPPASPITAAVGRALVDRGWTVRHRVGCGVYEIDLAVADPTDAERFVLAIELDGPAYATAPAARDRDRLRAQALASLGWRVLRIWSLDWWLDPEREIQRAHGAIVTAIAASRQRRAPVAPRVAPSRRTSGIVRIPPKVEGTSHTVPVQAAMLVDTTPTASIPNAASAIDSAAASLSGPIVRAESGPAFAAGSAPIRIAKGSINIGPYMVAAVPAGRRAPDDLFAPRHLPELGKVIEQVLAAEAPMHVDLLARRVGAYFGIGRVTQRVTDQVKVALAGRGRWGDETAFVWRMDQDPAGVPSVRVAGTGPQAARAIDEVPLAELAAAARIVVERAAGIGTKDLVRDAARLLGIARLTESVTARIAQGIRLAETRTLIEIDAGGKARMPA